MVDRMDLVDDVDTEKIHLRGCVHSVHTVHSVHCLDKSVRLRLPNLGLDLNMSRRTTRLGWVTLQGELILFDLVTDLVAGEAEELSGLCAVAACSFEGLAYQVFLDVLDLAALRGENGEVSGVLLRTLKRRASQDNVVRRYNLTGTQQGGAFDDVSQLADVSGPQVGREFL